MDDPELNQRATLPCIQILRKPAIYTHHACVSLPNAATVQTLAYTCLHKSDSKLLKGTIHE
jgi:hypothetical protein